MQRSISWFGMTLCAVALVGCSGKDKNWKETIPVTGIVTVDGEPAEGVMVVFHPAGGMDTAQPTETKSLTDADGKFAATTYELGDGAPPGDYKVTLTWPALNKISMSFDGDKFKGKYAKPEKSKFEVKIASGDAPVDMGKIEL